MESRDRIIIIGSANDGRLAELVSKHHNVEIMSPERAEEMNLPPSRIEFPIIPPIVFDSPTYFKPPLTRAERRRLKRKKH